MEINFESDGLSKSQLEACLRQSGGDQVSIVAVTKDRTTMADAATLTAVVTGGATVLTAIVTGLLNVLKEKKGSNITIECEGGKVVVPASTPISETAQYVAMVKGQAKRIKANM